MNRKVLAIGLIVVMAAIVLALSAAAAPALGGPPTPGVQPEGSGGPALTSEFLYQGRLTDSDGNPIADGDHHLTFSLYASPPYPYIPTYEVTVTTHSGFFVAPVEFSSYVHGLRFDLALQVDGGETFNPQEIYPVPYALSLRPGAVIEGSSPVLELRGSGGGNALLVHGSMAEAVSGEANNGVGVHGSSGLVYRPTETPVAGVLGEGSGDTTGVEAYSESGAALDATGTGTIRSSATSEWWISGNDVRKQWSTDTTRFELWGTGGAAIYAGGTLGSRWVFVPVSLPGVLFGQNVSVDKITVYYKCENGAHNYIQDTRLRKQTAADDTVGLIEDFTARTSNTATSYTIVIPGTERELSIGQGILGLHFLLLFVNDNEYVMIGGVRLTLSHN